MLSSVLQECLQEVARDPAPGGLPEGQGVKMLLCQDAPETPAGLSWDQQTWAQLQEGQQEAADGQADQCQETQDRGQLPVYVGFHS